MLSLPIKAPRRYMRLKRGLKRRYQLLKFVARQAGQIQELRRTLLHVGELYMCHAWCLL
jgi:hypothetical protein